VDDVLNDLMLSWLDNYKKEENRNTGIKYEDIVQNPPHEILGITQREYLTSLDNFRNSDKGINLTPNLQILKWFKKDGTKFRHIALTSRPKNTVSVLAAWLFRYFGDWIRTLSFIPSFREGEQSAIFDKSKTDFLKWLGKVDFFIDDSIENIKSAEMSGIKTFLYPQPWNNSPLTAEQILGEISKNI
jgi:hypothetical protein